MSQLPGILVVGVIIILILLLCFPKKSRGDWAVEEFCGDEEEDDCLEEQSTFGVHHKQYTETHDDDERKRRMTQDLDEIRKGSPQDWGEEPWLNNKKKKHA